MQSFQFTGVYICYCFIINLHIFVKHNTIKIEDPYHQKCVNDIYVKKESLLLDLVLLTHAGQTDLEIITKSFLKYIKNKYIS